MAVDYTVRYQDPFGNKGPLSKVKAAKLQLASSVSIAPQYSLDIYILEPDLSIIICFDPGLNEFSQEARSLIF